MITRIKSKFFKLNPKNKTTTKKKLKIDKILKFKNKKKSN